MNVSLIHSRHKNLKGQNVNLKNKQNIRQLKYCAVNSLQNAKAVAEGADMMKLGCFSYEWANCSHIGQCTLR